MAARPLESFEDVAQRFPGIEQLDPKAVGHFVFYSAGNFPEDLYKTQKEADEMRWQESAEESWESEVTQHLGEVKRWQQEQKLGSKVTRYGLAKAAEESLVLDNETDQLVELLGEADPNTGFDSIVEYLEKWGFKVGVNFAPSPMFLEGRYITKPVGDYINRDERYSSIPYGSQVFRSDPSDNEAQHLDDRVGDYLNKGHSIVRIKLRLSAAFEALSDVNPDELKHLREQYGAKSANLTTFKNTLDNFYALAGGEDGVQKIDIPPYVAVATDMYEAWQIDSTDYSTMLENARQLALKLSAQAEGGLVAIRSSAVYSEDGEEHTGAGIYKSVVVDPTDIEAFRQGVRDVYDSTTSPDALAYQASCGVSSERMGLLLQSYIEETISHHSEAYGFINSRGANTNIIEVYTPVGTLLFDKPRLMPSLLLDRWHDADDYLHSKPDHSKELRHMPNQVIAAVHAAIFAELIYQAPVQVEYVAKGQVVQIRPLSKQGFEDTEMDISFPDNIEAVVQTKSIGVGDRTLEELDDRDDNSNKEGYVVFLSEYGFTDHYNRSHRGLDSLPKNGAVVILNHSDSGHIQTLCQERGLMCFYPESKANELEGLKTYFDDNTHGIFDNGFDDFEAERKPRSRKLRFMTDGYNGRIYEV